MIKTRLAIAAVVTVRLAGAPEALALLEQLIRKQLLSRAATTGNAVSSEVPELQPSG